MEDARKCGAHEEAIDTLKRETSDCQERCRDDMRRVWDSIAEIKADSNKILGAIVAALVGIVVMVILQLVMLRNGS